MPYHNDFLSLYLGFITRTAEERKSSVLSALGFFYQIGLVPADFAASKRQFLKQISQLKKEGLDLSIDVGRGRVGKHLNAYNNTKTCFYSILLYKKHFHVCHPIWILDSHFLLRCNWYITLYRFKVYDMLIWYTYIWQYG